MNTSAKIGGLLAAIMLAASGSAMAAEPVNPYVTSSDGKVVMDPFGLCWRTGFWTPALAEALGYNAAVRDSARYQSSLKQVWAAAQRLLT